MGSPHSNRKTHIITFSCKHTRIFQEPAPSINEEVYCVNCRKAVRVVSAPPEWSVRCTDCLYSRRYGTSEHNADVSAVKHRMRHPGHVVKVLNGGELIRTYGQRNQNVIPTIWESDQTG